MSKEFKRKGFVSLPTIKLEEEVSYFLKFLTEFKLSEFSGNDKDGNAQKPAMVAKVENLENGAPGQIVGGDILVKDLNAYEGGYVGKSFEIIKHKVAGKRYFQYEIYEV